MICLGGGRIRVGRHQDGRHAESPCGCEIAGHIFNENRLGNIQIEVPNDPIIGGRVGFRDIVGAGDIEDILE